VTKRVLDIVVSLVGLLVTFPLLALAALAVRMDSPGPLLYRGRRVGKGGKPFDILKFRSMVIDAEKIGGSSTSEEDPRLTKSGRLLRRFKLDELPQLWNVLSGDMSLVGPRPQVQWAVDLYSDEERRLLGVRPGITDFASLRFRNEGEILKGHADPDQAYLELIAPEKIRLGLYYVDNRTISMDLRLILQTGLTIFKGEGR
jgi:lipopolysaccharide/colanic/teichoic acid biosynthesis glycosyltransferase